MERMPALPIVCYTIKPGKGLMERAYSAGAAFFLEKVPLALPEVHSLLKYILIYLFRKARKGHFLAGKDWWYIAPDS